MKRKVIVPEKISSKAVIEFIHWLDYERGAMYFSVESSQSVEKLKDSTRIFDNKYAVLLESLGMKSTGELSGYKVKK